MAAEEVGRSKLRKITMLFPAICCVLILSCCAVKTDAADCLIGGYNLTTFQTFNPWRTGHKTSDTNFEINFCDAKASCSNGITVSGQKVNSSAPLSYGDCTLHTQVKGSSNGELMAVVRGAPCPVLPAEQLTTVFYFKCGKTLGQPVYLGNFGCSVMFEWESYEFCTNMPQPAHEIPCYVFNNSQIIDLSPLTKLKGGYLVDQQPSREYYINVCRDITPDLTSATGSCTDGAGACRVMDGSGSAFGRPQTKLQVVGSEIKMTYTATDTAFGCSGHPTTVVTFKCPERGGSKQPQLLDDYDCNVQIEWLTEYACPQHTLTSEKCQLTRETHDIDIDLSPLTKPSDSPYHVSVNTSRGDTFDYYVNVCGQLGIPCGSKNDHTGAVCQVQRNVHDLGNILGDSNHMQLRYSDGQLSLFYKDGDKCNSTEFRRNTIINFECDQDAADNGRGKPEFQEATNCTYIFSWKTRYACVDHPVGVACNLQHDGKIFDLSDLSLEQGDNWLALSQQKGDEGYQYFVNVCHDVLHTGGAKLCPPGAAICRNGTSGSVSLGSYRTGLQYDSVTGNVFINYTLPSPSGHECPGVINSVLTFICKPGELESGPALVYKSSDACVYQFEWHTAAACPLSHQHGTDCRVVDSQAGYSFDLSGLMMKGGDGYKVSHEGYDYYLNVCGKISGDHCKDPPHDNAAACQVKQDGSGEFKTGEPSQTLEYFNGVLNLTYSSGDPYNDDNNTPRKTEIAFVCDLAAGKGHPEFVVEQNQMYSFKWLTAYACPTRPIECVARSDDGKEYDLSSLSKSVAGDNWVVLDDSQPANRRKFYINVCRPLAPVYGLTSSAGCDLNAAVCETALGDQQETVVVGNLGQAKSGPKVKVARDNFLSLEYVDGAPCPDGVEGARYNTTIHFICTQGPQSRGPSPPRKIGPCSYEAIWDTSAACALTEANTGENQPDSGSGGDSGGDSGSGSPMPSCVITEGGYIYNLNSLKKDGNDFYTAGSGSTSFRLNLCGAVSASSCGLTDGQPSSVCEVQGSSSDTTGLALASSMVLRLTDHDSITVTYTGHRDSNTGQMTEVEVELVCNRLANESSPVTFVGERQKTYQFRLETPVACPLHPVDCVLQDSKGNQYDLSPLAKLTGNYDVPDTRSSHADLHYLINVCRPINELVSSDCPGGPIGGCQTGSGNSYSLGYVESKPHVAEDGTITIRYVGGSLCHKDTPQQARRSMRITLYCSGVEGVPEFTGETDSCEYTFTWSTPSACPIQRTQGSDCKVSDPLYHFQFDLNGLRKTDGNYQVPGEGYTYQLNVCGPLHSAPEECTGMATCQTGNSLTHPVAAGKANSNVIYDTGELSLVYDDGKANCHGKYTRKTIITFVCDHAKPGANSGPEYLSEQEDCTYTFVWRTALACPPHRELVDCSYVDEKTGNHYDLSSLSLTGANYVKPYEEATYIINVCRSLVHRKGETCPFNAAACMINKTESVLSKKYQSLGEVSSSPVSMEEGQLVIRYNNGAPCARGGNMSTLIILSCPTNPSALEAGPSSHFVRDYCQHGFVWATSAACPITSGSSQGSPTSHQSPCTATNPVSHYEFDLSALKKSSGSYQVNDREGHYFYINVCGAVDNDKCPGSSSGSCQTEINGEERAFNAGDMNGNVQFVRPGLLMLKYSGGDVCHHSNTPRTTIINFVCHQDTGNGVPTYVDDSDDCVYYFDWHTELACEEQVLCEVSTGKETFDLTPLIKQSGHHLAVPDLPGLGKEQPRGTFYINMCRPLNPIYNTLCPAGAAACREISGQPPQSLGRAESPPVYDPVRKQVTLTYDHGQPCGNNTAANSSTTIIFICQRGLSEGVPRLVDVTGDCGYVFEWPTNLVCPEDQAVEKQTSNCSFYDPRTDFLYDLAPLSDIQQVDSPQGGKISIQACGSLPANLSASCKGSAVCLVGSRGLGSASLLDGSYGDASSGVFQMDSQRLKLTFSNGHQCQHDNTKKASTNIFFECDHSAGNGVPEQQPHFTCELNFRWRTSLLCPPLMEDCVTSWKDTVFDLAILSQTKESWEFIHQDGNRYWINLCQPVHGVAVKEKCPPSSAVCRHSNDGQVDMLGDLKSQKISVEDDGTVVIEYSQGTSACSSGRRRSNNPLARSVIRLQCGPTVGSPVLSSSKENMEKCLFEFTWHTRAVCKKDSLPQQVSEMNQVIEDPRSGGSIDLRPLLKGRDHHAFDGDSLYVVNLEGHPTLNHANDATTACLSAAVCQQNARNATFHRNLGTFASRQYYLNEDQLEVVYTSPEKCTGRYSHKPVSSIITFTCSSNRQRTDPVFRYRTVDCTYLFTWETPAACMQAKIEVATGGSADAASQPEAGGGGGKGGMNKTTLTTVVSIFSVVLILCLLAVVFHKPERRAAAAAKLKRVILCRRTTENQIQYSVLSQMEEDREADPVGTNPFEEDAENELQNGDTITVRGAGVTGYHDDSDDDMLL